MTFPDDWQEMKLSQISSYVKEKSAAQKKCYVSTENINQNFSGIKRYNDNEIISGIKFLLSDTLMSNIRPYLKKFWYADFNGVCNADVLVLRGNESVLPKFLYYLVANEKFVSYVMNSGIKGTKMPRGDKDYIMNYSVLLPPLAEQKAIAQTLSSFDQHIDNLAALIDKKKNIREGALEDLMSRHIRLKGFCGDWQEMKIKDLVIKSVGGGTPNKLNREYWNGSIPWMSVKDFANVKNGILNDTIDHISQTGVNNSSTNIVDENAIILCTRMGLGKCTKISRPVAINQDLCAIWLSENILDTYFIKAYSTLKILGAGSTVKGIKRKELFSYSIPVPPLDEQKAIAEVLTAFDEEIEALTAEREKYIRIRAGAMEDLLTGKIRLKLGA